MTGDALTLKSAVPGLRGRLIVIQPSRLLDCKTGQQTVAHRRQRYGRGQMLDEGIGIHPFVFFAFFIPFNLFTFRGHTHQGGRLPFGHAVAIKGQRQLQTTWQAGEDRTKRHLKPVHLQAVGAAGQILGHFDHGHESRGAMIVPSMIVSTVIMSFMIMPTMTMPLISMPTVIVFMAGMFVLMIVIMVMFMIVSVPRVLLCRAVIFLVSGDYKIHPALGAAARFIPDDFRVHRAGIFGPGIFVSTVVFVLITVVMVIMAMIVFMVVLRFLIMAMLVLVLVLVVLVIVVVFMIAAALRRRFPRFPGYQVHATFRAAARLVFDNFRMHGADILDPGVQNR